MTLHELKRNTQISRRKREGHYCAWAALCMVLTGTAWGQSQQQHGGVVLDSSESLFGVLAARVAAGEDMAYSSATGQEGRRFASDYLGRKQIPVKAELRAFFAETQPHASSAGMLSDCVSLGLLLGSPPNYKPTAPESSLPPDARKLAPVVPLLKSLYDQASLADLWAQMQPWIQGEIDRQSPVVRRAIELSDAYLRFPGGTYLGRTYAIIISPLGPPEQVQARIYGQNYYVVVTPSRDIKAQEIRHQYLHFLLDPLAYKYAKEIEQKSELKSSFRTAALLPADFKEDFGLFMVESLIYAVELRLDRRPEKEANARIEALVSQGFILVPYYYSALLAYEKQESSMSLFLKEAIEKIDIAQERLRASKVPFASQPAPAGGQPKPALSPEEALLNRADNLIAEGNYLEARTAYREVLDTLNARSERALFGLAVVSSNTRKPGLAEDYFRRTLEAAQDLRIVTWTHIYLGRIYDLQTDRRRALEEYQAAALTATSFPDAYRAVQDGLDRPFGFHK